MSAMTIDGVSLVPGDRVHVCLPRRPPKPLRWHREPVGLRRWEGGEAGGWAYYRTDGEVWIATKKTWDGKDRIPVGRVLRVSSTGEWVAEFYAVSVMPGDPGQTQRSRSRRRVDGKRFVESAYRRDHVAPTQWLVMASTWGDQ